MGKFIDLTGQKINGFEVIKRVENNKVGSAQWLVRCECGEESIRTTRNIKNYKHCSKCNEKKLNEGDIYGSWKVLYRTDNIGNEVAYMCKCICGKEKPVAKRKLLSGKSKSCGCMKLTKDGLTRTRQYNIWKLMKERCYNESNISYKNYGGRGIRICDEWLINDFEGFKNFYNWSLENGYEDDLTIDRIDVNGNYEPNNCRWATRRQQGMNKRDNTYIEYNGKTQTMQEWCEELNIKQSTLSHRYNEGLRGDELFADINNKIDLNKYKYISKNNHGLYIVKVGCKYIGCRKTEEEAIMLRDGYINSLENLDYKYIKIN